MTINDSDVWLAAAIRWNALGYDATPLSILIYVAAALCAAWLAARIARWVASAH